MSLDHVLSKLQNVKKLGNGEYSAQCPAHDDKKNSLAIRPTNDRILLYCHAHCSFESVKQAAGLNLEDLHLNGKGNQANGHKSKSRLVAMYDYKDSSGKLLYQSIRYEPKDFKQRQPNGKGGWIWSVTKPPVTHVPYRLPELLAADLTAPVFGVEGEKDVDRLIELGLIATTNVGGAGKWRSEYNRWLQGRHVVILPDNDEPGHKHAMEVAQNLLTGAATVKMVKLPDLPPKGDVSDWLNAGHTREELLQLTQTAPPLTAQALKELIQAQPIKDPETKIKSADYLAALKMLGYSFRLNVLDDTVEVNETPITDTLAATIRTRMRDAGYTKYLGAMEDAYITAAADNPYHPVKAYLESLHWDGQSHIDTLAGHFSDTQGVFALWLKKWLVGAAAKVYGLAQNPMLVLDGAQGKGKSYFVAWLCPLKKHFVESAIQPDSNDHKLLLMTTWIWEVSELGATTRKADREALKAFVTLTDITARKPYGKRPINKPAMASFIGTVNDEAGFLNDPTGSRRFLTCTLTRIDWGYTQLSRDDIWAEAYHLFRSGYNWRLTAEEQKLQAEINENYEIEDPWIPEVLRYYSKTDNPNDFVSSREILTRLALNHLEKRNTMRLAQVMKRLGVTKGKQSTKDNRQNGYFGLSSLL